MTFINNVSIIRISQHMNSNPYLNYLNSFGRKRHHRYNCVSLFSGGGGLDLGASMAGFKSLLVSDVNPTFTETLKNNIPHVNVYNDDAMKLTPEGVARLAGNPDSIDLIIAGPPCQAFSILGSRKSMDDPRGKLTIKYFELVAGLHPKAFLFENVPGLLNVNDGKDFESLYKFISDTTGYTLFKTKLNAMNFGVPQARERLFIVGFRPDVDSSHFRFPVKSSAPSKFNMPSLVPSGFALEKVDGLPNQSVRPHTKAVIERFSKVPQGGRDRGSYCDRIDPKEPSHTIVVGSSAGGARPHIHPTENRVITVREAARLQSFPDWYVFTGSSTEQYRQVGNAVPPLLAYEVTKQIRKILDDDCKRKAVS